MLKKKHIISLRTLTLLSVVTGLLCSLPACLEKDDFNKTPQNIDVNVPFALFNINLTFIDAKSKEPLPDLMIKLLHKSNSQIGSSDEEVTDHTGTVRFSIAAAPPAPQEFLFSLTDLTNSRLFQQDSFSVRFINPVFKYIPKDASAWGNFYQGTAEMTLTRELTLINHE